jgi:hypothetical protein
MAEAYQIEIIYADEENIEFKKEQEKFYCFHQKFYSNSFLKLNDNKQNINVLLKKSTLENEQPKNDIKISSI